MANITTRTGKGAALTHSELDDNFTNLNADKAELSGADFTGNISVDGNISVTGTVDGRDVATDGTKLDGIEASADVTDTTNVVASLTAGTNVTIAADGTISATDTNTQLTNEEVQDIVGAMLTGNTETGITVSYQDVDGTIDFVVDTQTDENFTTALKNKLDAIEAGATADQTAAEIRALVESATDSNVFTDADHTKLDGIETGADVTDTANVTAAGALMDSEVTNLADVKSFDPADYATAAQGTTADSALQNVSEDTTPQLGGNLDVNGQSIVSTTNGDINITPNGTGNVSLGNLTFDADQTIGAGQDNYVLTYDNTSGNISLEAATGGGLSDVVDDTTPQLGGNLDLNSNNITGTGNINTTGDITVSGTAESDALNVGTTQQFTVTNIGKVTTASYVDASSYRVGATSVIDNSRNLQNIGNITLTGTVDGRDLAADGTKLDGIAAGAEVNAVDSVNTQTGAVVLDADDISDSTTTNKFTTAGDITKLAGIEAGATADQTASEIRALVESATDSNVFTDADHTKLDAIEASADVTDTANVTAAGALMDSELTSEASVKALNQGVATTDSPSFAGLTVDTNTLKVDSTNNRVGILNAAPDVTLDVGSATDAVHVPVGTTAQRPSTPAAGYLRYNSTTGEFEGYTTAWGGLGSGSAQSDIFVDTMTGDGSTTTLTLTNGAATENNTQVYIDGVYQSKSNYSLSGTTITFSEAPPNLSEVEVITIEPTTINEPADGSVTSAKLSGDLTTPGTLSVSGSLTVDNTAGSPNQVLATFQADMGTNDRNFQIKSPTTDSASAPFRFTTGNSFAFEIDATTDAFVIDANANIGIGTTTPSNDLHVNSAGNTVAKISSTFSGSTTTGLYIDTVGDTSAARLLFSKSGVTRGIIGYSHNATANSEAITFGTAGGTERMRIDATGIDVTGTITFDGGTTSADLNFGDNDKAIFGAGSDLQIYHDGSNSFITENGTGYLGIGTNGSKVIINKSPFENMAEFITDGAVNLYHDNVQKFATTSTGIDVTGLVTADVLELTGGTSYDPSGGGTGTDTATDVGIALTSGTRIVGTNAGYIRSLLEWNASSEITIGQSGTSLITGIDLIPGSSGNNVKVNGNRILTVADEGSGNGLDADTLDGQELANFTLDNVCDRGTTTNQSITVAGLTTAGVVQAGSGSGGVALTNNDGYGNANVTFNHKSGTPEQNGQSGRIEVNTDTTTGAGYMSLEVSSAAVTSGTPVSLTAALIVNPASVDIPQRLSHSGDADTYLEFTTDRIQLVAGGVTAFDSNSGGSGLTSVKSFKTFMTADATVNGSTTYTTKNVFNTTASINVGSFSVAASGVTVPEDGVYMVMANMMYNSTVLRANPGFRFAINGTGQPEEALSAYIRGASGHNEASSSLSTLYNLSANDVIGLQFAQEGAAGTVNLETGSHIAIYRVS